MIIKKKILSILLVGLGFYTFAQDKTIRSLTMDFEISESTQDSEESIIQGSFEYNFDPFIFVYTTTTPVKQTLWTNPDGTFLDKQKLEAGADSAEEILVQYCDDFLTLLKTDFGFNRIYFKDLSYFDKESQSVVTLWYKTGNATGQNYPKYITTWTDEKNCIIKCQTYNDEKACRIYYFDDFYNYRTADFPCSVLIENVKDEKVYSTITYTFKNIKINRQVNPEYIPKVVQIEETERRPELKTAKIYGRAEVPPPGSYKISFTQIGMNAGYSFYKAFITGQDASDCMYSPTCSAYMMQAVSKNGIAGFFQGIDRLTRCTEEQHSSGLYPLTKEGKHYDPVP